MFWNSYNTIIRSKGSGSQSMKLSIMPNIFFFFAFFFSFFAERFQKLFSFFLYRQHAYTEIPTILFLALALVLALVFLSNPSYIPLFSRLCLLQHRNSIEHPGAEFGNFGKVSEEKSEWYPLPLAELIDTILLPATRIYWQPFLHLINSRAP